MTVSKFNTYTETLQNGFSFEMLYILGGNFDMGSTDDDIGAYDDEKPIRKNLTVSPFYMAFFPVSQALWKAVLGNTKNPSGFVGDNRPVENITWFDTQKFIKKLNIQTKSRRKEQNVGFYRLSTETEWEYAAQGAHLNTRYRYAGSDKLKEVGWFEENSGIETQEIGKLLPNALGLFDMTGNVWEWVEDDWHDNYIGAPSDERAWYSKDKSKRRVLRGGTCFGAARDCRIASRGGAQAARNVGVGFRLAMSISNKILP